MNDCSREGDPNTPLLLSKTIREIGKIETDNLLIFKISIWKIILLRLHRYILLKSVHNNNLRVYMHYIYGALFAKPTSFLDYLSNLCFTVNFYLFGCLDHPNDWKRPWISMKVGRENREKKLFFHDFHLSYTCFTQ